ncbi:MAG: hypothetical protein ACW99Q_25015 [Candidatus Kariarchaeaceae archaeon]|jgi:hypothetical protein
MKRKEHIIDSKDIELNPWEFQLVMGEAWDDREILINNFFCDCKSPNRQLIGYKIYLNDINDIILRGKCSGCKTIVARYIETGENSKSVEAANRIRKMKKDSS